MTPIETIEKFCAGTKDCLGFVCSGRCLPKAAKALKWLLGYLDLDGEPQSAYILRQIADILEKKCPPTE